jgi:hypothetical protein
MFAEKYLGDMKYITPEIAEMINANNGELNAEIAAAIAENKISANNWNPTGDLQYALWNAQQTGNTEAAEALGALKEYMDEWRALDDIEHQGEVYGNTDIPNNFNEDNPVVVAPTIDEYKDACKEGIREALDERQPTNITLEMNGREVGYGVADAMAVENVQFNPEVAVV